MASRAATESVHDVMDGGHAGTGISIAEGLALARDRRGGREHIAVVVGDAALMSGLSLEALNDIGQRKTRIIILLNDNEMSISPTVGAVSQYLSRIKLSRALARLAARAGTPRSRASRVSGPVLLEWSRRFRHAVVDLSQPGRLFEDLGVTYVGPVPGHDLVALDRTLRKALQEEDAPDHRPRPDAQGLRLPPGRGGQGQLPRRGAAAHARGVGQRPSEWPGTARPDTHGRRCRALRGRAGQRAGQDPQLHGGHGGRADPASAAEDERIVAITAGMPTGTGVATFGERYPDRTFDVGIAEQHAMTMATGLALAGQRPFVALYSTFLQRAFDQVVHDVCQNDVPVVIGIDRAGLVGEDGTSHQGMFTLSALRQLPNLVLAAPRDEQELRRLLRTAFAQDHPFAIQYPRDPGFDLPPPSPRRRSRSGVARPCARARTSSSWASGPSWPAVSRSPIASRWRAGRWVSSTRASRNRSTAT